ncbi:MAG TPA: PAS domain-containing protein, partial [Gaiellaceae bacterium]|nr:PAS domain-containing protein [Gaiellaceae bacterium]
MDDALRSSFFASSSVPFAMANPAGVLLDVNAAFAAVVGRPERELRGLPLADLLHPEEAGAVRRRFAAPEAGDSWVTRLQDGAGGWRSLRWTT